jgi:HEPN domain-containing protein
MKRSAREWLQKAEGDSRLAVQTAEGDEPFHDHVCFLCQQAAEKHLKAVLEELGLAIPKTHNLDDLLGLLHARAPVLRRLRRGLIFLTDFAVAVRYPGKRASRRQAKAALRWAEKVRSACRSLLGV